MKLLLQANLDRTTKYYCAVDPAVPDTVYVYLRKVDRTEFITVVLEEGVRVSYKEHPLFDGAYDTQLLKELKDFGNDKKSKEGA